jgi:purine-binding chemotaxis protein CheW
VTTSAHSLGRETAEAPAGVLVVEVGGHRCGLPVEVVVELHRMVASVPLPEAPAVVDGVIDVHGTVVAVLDPRTRFGLSRRPASPSDHLVLVRVEGRTVALRVDRVLDLVTLPVGAVVAALGLPPDPHLRGAARLDGGLLLIHDVGAFLSDDEAACLDDALAGLGAPGGDEP